MKNIIQSIYRGEFDVLDGPFDEESGRIHERMELLLKQVKQKIPPEQHPMLDEYEKLSTDLLNLSCEKDFMAGFRFGAQLLIVALSE